MSKTPVARKVVKKDREGNRIPTDELLRVSDFNSEKYCLVAEVTKIVLYRFKMQTNLSNLF